MILGMTPFTFFHVVLSLIGILSGLFVLYGLLASKRLAGWTAVFLATTLATSVTGFLFPFRGMPDWAQWLGTIIPVTHMLRVVRGAMLKGVGISESATSLAALTLFVLVVAAIAIKQYRTTLD